MLALSGAGLDLVCRQERKFVNRFGKTIYEDLLHFEIDGEPVEYPEDLARDISTTLLKDALARAQDTVKEDITSAIEQVDKVEPSPMLQCSVQPAQRDDQYEAVTA
jgi:hypothetical protein